MAHVTLHSGSPAGIPGRAAGRRLLSPVFPPPPPEWRQGLELGLADVGVLEVVRQGASPPAGRLREREGAAAHNGGGSSVSVFVPVSVSVFVPVPVPAVRTPALVVAPAALVVAVVVVHLLAPQQRPALRGTAQVGPQGREEEEAAG